MLSERELPGQDAGDFSGPEPDRKQIATADPAEPAPANTSRLIRRQRIFLAITTGAALLAIGGLVLSTFIKSPAQAAASTQAPQATVLTAAVKRQVLTDSVVTRGTVGSNAAVTFTPAAEQGATTLTLTAIRKPVGSTIEPGDVIAEVSGRPVIALSGAVPAYRDLKPGDTGADVTELQSALKSLGYRDTDASATFGPGTKAALAALYAHLGYDPAYTGGPNDTGDQTTLQAAAQAVTQQDRAVVTAEQSLAAASGSAAIASARQALTWAHEDLDTAHANQAALTATTGVMLPLGEYTFLPTFPAQLTAIGGTIGSAITAPLLTIDSGALTVTSVLNQAQAASLKPGMTVQLDSEALGLSATATITGIGPYSAGNSGNAGTGADNSGSSGSGISAASAGYPMTVTPTTALPSAWLGQDVRVTITAASSNGPVLVVPVAAVSTGADGQTSVTVQESASDSQLIPVNAGMDADGFVAVTPLNGYRLTPGENVVIGQ